MKYFYNYTSPLGNITLASDGRYITGLWFEGQKYFAEGMQAYSCKMSLPIFEQCIKWLDIYFGGTNPDFTVPVKFIGTPFQVMVWNILQRIPYGATTTYGEIARKIAELKGLCSMSSQAVGGAVGRNPISIIVPCHRVIGCNGKLTGYAGGLNRKQRLLQLEGIK